MSHTEDEDKSQDEPHVEEEDGLDILHQGG